MFVIFYVLLNTTLYKYKQLIVKSHGINKPHVLYCFLPMNNYI